MSQWHYTHNGQRVGPVDLGLLRSLVLTGDVGPADMAWKNGMQGWQAVATLPELALRSAMQTTVAYGSAGSPGAWQQPAEGAGALAAAGDYAPRRPSAMDHAGFWLRVGAYIIDEIIVSIAVVVGFAFVFGTESLNPNNLQMQLLLKTALVVVSWLYYAIQEGSSRQATVGKRILGLRVVDQSGEPIGLIRASVRYFGKILSGLICGIGYLMVGFTEEKQGLHDMIAGTYVVTTWG